ncbi:MAG: SufE family protein [Alphaproteobacteria bacterium]|nr:MAG: SufE family protein [Alphaproteobacteria bacterium]
MSIEDLAENFTALDDWEDRYKYLIDLGNTLPPMDESLKTEAVKVRGCMSQVWMVLGWDSDGRLTLLADSDAQIVRGLIAVLSALFSGKTAEEAARIDVEKDFQRLGLDQHISPNRRNGFFSMVEAVRAFTSRRI